MRDPRSCHHCAVVGVLDSRKLGGYPNAHPDVAPKNQVSLPADIVRLAGLHVGEPLTFTVREGTIIIETYSPHNHDEDWLTTEVIAEIEQAPGR